MKTDAGALGVIRKEVSATLADTNVGGVQGFFDWMLDTSARMGSDASSARWKRSNACRSARTSSRATASLATKPRTSKQLMPRSSACSDFYHATSRQA